MDTIKYTNEEIKGIISDYGLTLIEYKSTTNIVSSDNDGYKYKVNLSNLLNRKQLPHKFMKNPFVIENIKTYFSIHFPDLELLDTEYINCKTKIGFICKKHIDKGIQYKTLDNLINRGQGCKYCGYERMGADRSIDTQKIIDRCNELDLEYIDRYSKNGETWVKFRCKIHVDKGVQEAAWYHFKECSKGCKYCVGKDKTTDDFIDEMHLINDKIEILGEYNGSENPIKCKCKICGHIWSPIGRSLKNGQGCPNCTMSNGEMKVKDFLDANSITYISQKTFDDCTYKGKLKFDFYLPDHNVVIEYDGIQHFKPVDFAGRGESWAESQFEINKLRDSIKNEYCENNSINLIRIPYFEIENVEYILNNNLKTL